jgi:hypothetical protein
VGAIVIDWGIGTTIRLTTLLPYQPTTLLSYYPTTLLSYYLTVLLFPYCLTALLPYYLTNTPPSGEFKVVALLQFERVVVYELGIMKWAEIDKDKFRKVQDVVQRGSNPHPHPHPHPNPKQVQDVVQQDVGHPLDEAHMGAAFKCATPNPQPNPSPNPNPNPTMGSAFRSVKGLPLTLTPTPTLTPTLTPTPTLTLTPTQP